MSLLDTLVTLKAVEFDVLRGLFPVVEGSIVYLLQPDGVVKNYKLTNGHAGLTTGWRTVVVMKRLEQIRQILIATNETDFWKTLANSSHLAIGSTVFNISSGTDMPPSDKYPYYTLFIEPTGEAFTP